MGNPLILVSVEVGIKAGGCTGRSNGPKLGHVMCQKPRRLALAEELLPFALFYLCVARVPWEIMDIEMATDVRIEVRVCPCCFY